MKRKISTRLNMYNAVLEICKSHEPSWAGIPGFVSTVNELETALKELDASAELQSSRTVGVRAAKIAKLEELCDCLILLQGALAIHGKAIGNTELRLRNKISPSELKHFSASKLNVHLNKVVSDLSNFGNELEPYGISTQFLADSIDLIEEARLSSTRPRMAIIERKLHTKSLDDQVTAIDELIKFQMDTLIRLFKKTVPEFYVLYFNARVLYNPSTKKPNADGLD